MGQDNLFVCFILRTIVHWSMACNTSEGSREPAPPPPPIQGKKRKELRRKKSRQGKQNKTTPPPSSRSETATEYAYKHYFFMATNSSSMIKQLLKLNWLSQKCSVCMCLAFHYGNNYYVQPLEDMKNYSVSLAQIIFTCMMTSEFFFSHVGKVEKMCWAKLKHSHSNTTASNI